jgi:hypothetical protein
VLIFDIRDGRVNLEDNRDDVWVFTGSSPLNLDLSLGSFDVVFSNKVVRLARIYFAISEWARKADGVGLNFREAEKSKLEKDLPW